MNRKWTWKQLLLMIPILIMGCYPQGPEFTSDADVVLTDYNKDYNFKAKATYAIPAKIVKITGSKITGDPPVYVLDALAAPMLAQMQANMNALGYTKVDISQNPDLILAPSALETTTISYWYDYWGWYWGGYYPGWGYPYYPYGGYTTSYTTGTLIMMLIDPKIMGGDGTPISQWQGIGNGVFTYAYDINRVNRLIDQSFKQSPYLKK